MANKEKSVLVGVPLSLDLIREVQRVSRELEDADPEGRRVGRAAAVRILIKEALLARKGGKEGPDKGPEGH